MFYIFKLFLKLIIGGNPDLFARYIGYYHTNLSQLGFLIFFKDNKMNRLHLKSKFI